jgi:hypothetical protein
VTFTGSTPADHYLIKVKIVAGGTLGTATFAYSLDGGATYSVTLTTQATYLMPGTGVTINFPAGTYSADNVYSVDSGNLGAFLTVAAAVKTHMETAEANSRYAFAILEAPDAYDTALETSFVSFVSPRVMIAAGHVETSSEGKSEKRSSAWVFASRLAAIPVGEDPARRASGPIGSVKSLYRDERKTEYLDAKRFATLQTDLGMPGFYCVSGRMMAASGSDFAEVAERRVMDVACRIARVRLKKYQADSFLVTQATGKILEVEARRIEQYVAAGVRDALGDQASAVAVEVVRTDNILSTKKLRARVRVTPLARAKSIEATVGFNNPALAVTG